MYVKQQTVALVLAGGGGTRLRSLTNETAKPAVTFGGKYKIIDFTLSNCVNSGIGTVGVLTQYKPSELSEHIGAGEVWDFDRKKGGIFILPPYFDRKGGSWYSGTADAVYRNTDFIKRYGAKNVLILSGDHVYKMDYGRMIEEHERREADLTVAVFRVPLTEAKRYGIMTVDGDLFVTGFDEKPDDPLSDVASMGVYVFNSDVLYDLLSSDADDQESEHDFGRNVIPSLLSKGGRILAYPYFGYWRDVGTVQSLWEANMDLLGETPPFDPYDLRWSVATGGEPLPPTRVGTDAEVRNSLLSDGSFICGVLEDSVVSPGVTVESGAVVKRSVLMDNVKVKRGARVIYSVVGRDSVVGEGARIGSDAVDPDTGKNSILLIENGSEISSGAVMRAETETVAL